MGVVGADDAGGVCGGGVGWGVGWWWVGGWGGPLVPRRSGDGERDRRIEQREFRFRVSGGFQQGEGCGDWFREDI